MRALASTPSGPSKHGRPPEQPYPVAGTHRAEDRSVDAFSGAEPALIDLALALVYVGLGIVPLSVAAFPMTNAAIFAAGLAWCLRDDKAASLA